MKAVIQRVDSASLSVDGAVRAEIGRGLVVYLGIEQGDGASDVEKFAKKLVMLRIFSDENDKMNLSVCDVGGEILLVSNFTLCADISHGNRPSFTAAMKPPAASDIYNACARELNKSVTTRYGIFGADMKISQVNAGPVTIIY